MKSSTLHSVAVLVVLDGDRARGRPRSTISSLPVGGLERRRGRASRRAPRTPPGGGSGTARGRTRARSPRRGSPRAACGPRRAARRTRRAISVGAGRDRRRTAARRAAAPAASWTSARASRARWRWPPESSPKRTCPPRSREPDALERGARRLALGPARRQPPAARRERAHQRHVERADREVEPRALGLRHVRRPAAQLDPAGQRLELAEERAEEGGLAAAVRAEHADRLAGVGGEARRPSSTGAPS